MATRGSKRVVSAQNTQPGGTKRGKRKAKGAEIEEELTEVTPVKKKTLGVKKNRPEIPLRVTPPRGAKKSSQSVARAPARKVSVKNRSKDIKQVTAPVCQKTTPRKEPQQRGRRAKDDEDAQSQQDAQHSMSDRDDDDESNNDLDTSSQQVRKVTGQIKDLFDQADIESGWTADAAPGERRACSSTQRDDADLLSKDSDDSVSADGLQDMADQSQQAMEGNVSYVAHPLLDGQEEEEGGDLEGEGGEENLMDVSKMRMVPEKVDYDDATKSMDEWWSEDPSREQILCDLWREEPTLYDMQEPGHRIPSNRDTILRKFATILHVPPPIIHTRMTSLRSMYQKLCKAAPSGSASVGKTVRQKEVGRLLFFLREHVKKTPSVTSYKGKSPAKTKYSYQQKPKTAQKSTPKKTPSRTKDAGEPTGSEGNLYSTSLSPIEGTQQATQPTTAVTQSDDYQLQPIPSDDEEESPLLITKKHFSRNQRLLDEKTVEVSAKKSLRLSPISGKQVDLRRSPKKHGNPALVKSSSVKSSCHFTADKAPPVVVSDDDQTPAPEQRGTPQKKNKVIGTIVLKTPNREETAADRYKRLVGKPSKVAETSSAADAHNTAAVQKAQPSQGAPTRPKVNVKEKVKKAQASTSHDESEEDASVSQEVPSYSVAIDPVWYEKQGAAYRKKKEAEAAKKKKADVDPMLTFMKEKSENFKKMIDVLGEKTQPTHIGLAGASSPEQLWADSLVPQLNRMSQETRDYFMFHVLGLAFKAIKGTWPKTD